MHLNCTGLNQPIKSQIIDYRNRFFSPASPVKYKFDFAGRKGSPTCLINYNGLSVSIFKNRRFFQKCVGMAANKQIGIFSLRSKYRVTDFIVLIRITQV